MKKIENAAEIDAKIDIAKSGTAADRARVGVDLIVALKAATGTHNLNDLGAIGGDARRLRDRCLTELLNIPAHTVARSDQTA